LLDLVDPRLEHVAAGERSALVRCPRADLAVARATGEVAIRLGRIGQLDGSFDADLLLERRPVLAERGARVARQLAGLATAVIRVEHESPLVHTPEQHDTY